MKPENFYEFYSIASEIIFRDDINPNILMSKIVETLIELLKQMLKNLEDKAKQEVISSAFQILEHSSYKQII